ncbi:MAG: cyanoexosortase A [Oculatellaceae cyanobacterium Prado106]|jgi:cyanoexosortase A|nr:cyanoexosortase A [Oculatellaceae cyanobacterium Prado106]
MNIDRFSRIVIDPQFWLCVGGAGLAAIHLTQVFRTGQDELFSSSLLYWVAVGSLVWKKRDQLRLGSSVLSISCGILLMAIVLLRSQSIAGFDAFLRVAPLLSAIALALLASGISGLKQYWQEFVVLSFLIPHSALLSQVFDASPLTAEFATVLLWILGFDVSRQGVYVSLLTGSVEVNPGCSGYGNMVQLLSIAVIYLFMFPTKRWQQLGLPIAAILLGFTVNGIRVALMVVLASSNSTAFQYWHEGEGSLIFSLLSVLILGCWIWSQSRITEGEER